MNLPSVNDFYDTTGKVVETMPLEFALYTGIRKQKNVNDLIWRICDHYYIYKNRSQFCTWASPLRDAICRDAMFFDEPEYSYSELLPEHEMRCRRPMYHNIRRVVIQMMEDIPEASDGYDVENKMELLKVICKQCRTIYQHNQKLNFKAKLTGGEQVNI